jgi:diguanylate cyclase (GGDEF)-like protein
MFRTYRSRLIFYTILLLALLTGTLAYTYYYSRSIILEEAENSVASTARLLAGNIEMEENELLHYAEVMRDDQRIQEYTFMVTKVGSDGEALGKLHQRQFGWLPVERSVFIGNDGQILLGEEHPDLAQAVIDHIKYSKDPIFYFQGSKGLELVTWATVSYQGMGLAVVALTHILNSGWLAQHRIYSGGHLFIEKNNIVNLSTLPNSEGKAFIPRDGHVVLNDETYRISHIRLANEGKGTPHLWHGVSEEELLTKLSRHSRLALMLAVTGCAAILIIGLMIIRNFSRPLTQLMQITQAVAQGTLPMLDKSEETNEIDTLANRFAEMLQALREKQQEIDHAHKRLEESAITDSLTELYNRRYLKQAFPKILAQAQREDQCLSGLMLDLDHFKKINDQHGHLAGDKCLMHLAALLREISRASDYVFRVGGEEFLVLSISESPAGGKQLAEKIRNTLQERPCVFNDLTIPMTTSIGVSRADNKLAPDTALTHLLFQADKALYQAKGNGRNQVVAYKHLVQRDISLDTREKIQGEK